MNSIASPRSPLAQHGFTMVVTIAVMLVTSLLLVGAFTAAQGEIHLTGTDISQKKAYYAAEAGVSDYEYHLTQDGNYLSYCTEGAAASNTALNQQGSTARRATVPSSNGESTNEQYAIELLPAESAPPADKKCDPANAAGTMIEASGGAAGTFRIRSTGYSGKAKSTVVATFRNANFVSYVWYTKYETGDPSLYGPPTGSQPSNYWTQCGQFYGERPSRCNTFDNYFSTGETVKGPLHTEDHAGVCGSPVFGRTGNDRIEFGHSFGGDEGYSREACPSAATPTFTGRHILPAEVPSLEPPPGDEELAHVVESAYEFSGKTEIVLEGSTMKIKTHVGTSEEETKSNVAFPASGVIYVSGGCSELYSAFGPVPGYSEDTTCGNVYVRGEYTTALTIAAQNDVVINGNITTPHNSEGVPTSNAMLGLIANNFVRIYHPLTGTRENKYTKCGSATNDTTESPADLNEPTIYAAILALKHAVIVDNFDCGSPTLGHVNIYGAVAGLFSNGLTGLISGSTLVHGYSYNAVYDNRLQVEEPPHFLNPIQAAWYVQRQTLGP